MKVLTPDQIKLVSKKFNVNFVKKDSSFVMKVASRIVPIFSQISKNEFMKYYVTTLFNNIYYTDPSDLELDLVVHELTHVLQFRDGSFLQYVTKAGRALLEGRAKCAEIELDLSIGESYNIEDMAEMLLEYGLGDAEVRVVRNMLLSTEKSFKNTQEIHSDVVRYILTLV
jgi:hypothetical protein